MIQHLLKAQSLIAIMITLGLYVPVNGQRLEFIELQKDSSITFEGLEGIVSVATSPEDSYVYSCSFTDNAVVVFKRDPVTSKLVFIEIQKDNVNGVDGLEGANHIAVSPDGKSVYVAAINGSSVSAFSRNSITGKLNYQATYRDNENGIDGLRHSSSVSISPDNKSVYVTSLGENSVAVFSRDLSTGLLTFIEQHKEGIAGVSGLSQVYSSKVSPDNEHIYITGNGNSVAVFDRNTTTGTLTFLESQTDNINGIDGLEGATSVILSQDGKYVYISGETDKSIAVFERDLTTGLLTFVEVQKDGINGVTGLDGASCLAITKNENFIYASSYIASSIVVFSRNAATGKLTYIQTVTNNLDGVNGINGATSIAISSDNHHLYIAGLGQNSLASFSIENPSGEISFLSAYRNGKNEVIDGLEGAAEIAISQNGEHMYIAGNEDSSIALFTRSPLTGKTTYQEVYKDGVGTIDGLAGATFVTITPDGKHVIASGIHEHKIAVFNRDELTGKLTFNAFYQGGALGIINLRTPAGIAVSNDNNNVYVAAAAGASIIVFKRDASTGTLTYMETQKDGINGVDGLNFTTIVKVSGDGKYVYACGGGDHAIVVFSRNVTTGSLTFLDLYKDGVNGIEGLTGVIGLTISPDGKYVYTISNENSIALFRRDENSGLLDFQETYISNLTTPFSMVISSSGKEVYVTSNTDNAIATFLRNESTGQLTYFNSYTHQKLNGPYFIAVSPDEEHLYVTSDIGNSILAFKILNLHDAPADLNAVAEETTIGLTWTASIHPDIDSYDIYRNTTNDPSSATVIGNVSLTTFNDHTAAAGITYYYWIKAKTEFGNESDFSSITSAVITISTGLVGNNLAASVKVYPNPSSGTFNISCNNDQSVKLEIINAKGEEIIKLTLDSGPNILDLSTYPDGLYFVKMSNEKSAAGIKLIKE